MKFLYTIRDASGNVVRVEYSAEESRQLSLGFSESLSARQRVAVKTFPFGASLDVEQVEELSQMLHSLASIMRDDQRPKNKAPVLYDAEWDHVNDREAPKGENCQ